MSNLVTKTHGGATFSVTDPASYPYGRGTFDEDEPIHEAWARFGTGHTVVDIGASFGSFTLPALARGAKVIAFEPSDGWDILVDNVQANLWGVRLWLYHRILWDGTVYPQKLEEDVFGRSYPSSDPPHYDTLDSVLAWWATPIHAIKIDVEGAELGVLRGGIETLKKWHPVLLVEDHDGIAPGEPVSDYPASIDSSRQIHSMLHDLGYTTTVLPFGCGRKYIVAEVTA